MRKRFLFILVIFFIINATAFAQTASQYKQPSAEIVKMLEAPPFPSSQISPDGRWMLLSQRPAMPSIAELAQPMLRLAGTRISPRTNSSFPSQNINKLSLLDLNTNQSREITIRTTYDSSSGNIRSGRRIPAQFRFSYVSFSPDSRRIAFTQKLDNTLELWVVDVATGTANKVPIASLNATTGRPYHWLPDSSGLLCLTVSAGRGAEPKESEVPTGPKIQETAGEKAAVATYQDLLKNAYDEELFKYYFTSELTRLDLKTGKANKIGQPAIFNDIEIAPGGSFIYVSRIVAPYSYYVPYQNFAQELEVWNMQGAVAYKIASVPLAEKTPVGGVRTGPRTVQWQPNEPQTLIYAEALDEGNPKKQVPYRDRVMQMKVPTKMAPRELFKTAFRFAGLQWTEKGDLAIYREFDRPTRKSRTYLMNFAGPEAKSRLLFDLLSEDRYNNPGEFLTTANKSGHNVLQTSSDGQFFYLRGQGASAQGERPFLRKLNISTLKTEELFRSQDPYYESVTEVLDADAKRFLTSRESVNEPPNYYLHEQGAATAKALTNFADPQPQLRKVKKQLLTYKRSDGITLSGTLYLPPDYQAGERRPAFIWAYPAEFASADAASQVSGSANRFTRVAGASHLFLALQGYVVLDNAAMPILGGEKANDTFVDQLVLNAKAAIDKIVEMGVADRDRIGVGGHSYGAFMTANLLAHCDLFRAGIARSGAYNRTLTPFTFQNERRSFWEATAVYAKMSPFFHAEKINEPILLIHGEADNNSGTFPIQTERLYAALKGLGKTARYVTLPLESHGYAARESNLHTLYEMINWMNKHVKPPKDVASN
jgi:dipeptidyl aminopeptidase/acylaminoacyl peptidase